MKITDYVPSSRLKVVKATCDECEKQCTNFFIEIAPRFSHEEDWAEKDAFVLCYDCFKLNYQDKFFGDRWKKRMDAQIAYDRAKKESKPSDKDNYENTGDE